MQDVRVGSVCSSLGAQHVFIARQLPKHPPRGAASSLHLLLQVLSFLHFQLVPSRDFRNKCGDTQGITSLGFHEQRKIAKAVGQPPLHV